MRLPVVNIATYIPFRTISKILRIIGQIFAVDREGYLSLTFSVGESLFRIAKFGLKKLETPLCYMVRCKAYFDISNRLRVTHECDGQTDGRTDVIIANTALNYVARPMVIMTTMTSWQLCWILTKRVRVGQLWRHGSEDGGWEDCRRSVFSERGTRHCTSGSGDRVQFQPHLSSEPALRQTKGTEGTDIARDTL